MAWLNLETHFMVNLWCNLKSWVFIRICHNPDGILVSTLIILKDMLTNWQHLNVIHIQMWANFVLKKESEKRVQRYTMIQLHSKLTRQSRSIFSCIFWAISELDHNASMAWSLGFSLPFALLALQSPWQACLRLLCYQRAERSQGRAFIGD